MYCKMTIWVLYNIIYSYASGFALDLTIYALIGWLVTVISCMFQMFYM